MSDLRTTLTGQPRTIVRSLSMALTTVVVEAGRGKWGQRQYVCDSDAPHAAIHEQHATVGYSGDTDDFIKFIATGNGTVFANLTGLSADIDLLAYNSSQIEPDRARSSQIEPDRSEASGTSNESIQFSVGAGQTYYIRVDPYLTAASGYSLTVTFQSSQPINQPPTSLTVTTQSVTENVSGATAATFSLVDPDTVASGFATYTYVISGEQASKFQVSGNTIRLVAGQSLDYEVDSSLSLTLTAANTNNASHVISRNFTVSVTDVNETPANRPPTATIADHSLTANEWSQVSG
jgi:hypothetical protein